MVGLNHAAFSRLPFLRSLSLLFEITPTHCLFICKGFLTPSPLLPLWETICLSPLSTPSITSTNTETNPQAANTNTRESYNSYHFNVFLEKFSDLPSTVIVASYRQLPEVTLWNANHWKSESILKRNPEISIAFRKLFQGTVKKSALCRLSLNSSGSFKRTFYLIFSKSLFLQSDIWHRRAFLNLLYMTRCMVI